MVLAMEAIGDITATCDVSRLEVDGEMYDSRIQGGILSDGLSGVIAALCTITPMSCFAQVSSHALFCMCSVHFSRCVALL
jgi:xanthine/uracil permease